MRKSVAASAAVFVLAPLVATPANAATVIEQPCILSVPTRITVNATGPTRIVPRIVSCPAMEHTYVNWSYPPRVWFSYDPALANPGRDLFENFYAADVGHYAPDPELAGEWTSGGDTHQFAITGNTFRVKRASNVNLTVAKRGTVRTIKATGKYHADGQIVRAPAVQILRNGKVWRTVRTNSAGVATATNRSSGKWSARVTETTTNWAATSRTLSR